MGYRLEPTTRMGGEKLMDTRKAEEMSDVLGKTEPADASTFRPEKPPTIQVTPVDLKNNGTFKLKDVDGRRAIRIGVDSKMKSIIIQKVPNENNKIAAFIET